MQACAAQHREHSGECLAAGLSASAIAARRGVDVREGDEVYTACESRIDRLGVGGILERLVELVLGHPTW